MKVGEYYIVKGFKDKQIAAKLLTLGFLPLTEFLFVRKSPFGGTYYFNLHGNKIALRKAEVGAIKIEKSQISKNH